MKIHESLLNIKMATSMATSMATGEPLRRLARRGLGGADADAFAELMETQRRWKSGRAGPGGWRHSSDFMADLHKFTIIIYPLKIIHYLLIVMNHHYSSIVVDYH